MCEPEHRWKTSSSRRTYIVHYINIVWIESLCSRIVYPNRVDRQSEWSHWPWDHCLCWLCLFYACIQHQSMKRRFILKLRFIHFFPVIAFPFDSENAWRGLIHKDTRHRWSHIIDRILTTWRITTVHLTNFWRFLFCVSRPTVARWGSIDILSESTDCISTVTRICQIN